MILTSRYINGRKWGRPVDPALKTGRLTSFVLPKKHVTGRDGCGARCSQDHLREGSNLCSSDGRTDSVTSGQCNAGAVARL